MQTQIPQGGTIVQRQPNPTTPPVTFDGPGLQGVAFTLRSGSGKPTHTLTITGQTTVTANYAFLQGTWQGDGPTPKNFTGSLTDGVVSITCSWANGMGGTNTLIGRISVGSPIIVNLWALNGNVVVTNGQGAVVPGAGPGAVSGEGRAPEINA
jgi:hypothetical protein